MFTTITCSLKFGSRPIEFKWKKNGDDLKKNKDFEISHISISSILAINQIGPSSSGNYTCEAKNSFGSDSYTTLLNVNGKFNY